jgi:hypothetical protein
MKKITPYREKCIRLVMETVSLSEVGFELYAIGAKSDVGQG